MAKISNDLIILPFNKSFLVVNIAFFHGIVYNKTGVKPILKTIFIVDDSDTNLATAESALEDHYNVMTVPSAAKMFALLEKMTPNLILLDIEMPEMNGFDALAKLKSNPAWAAIPVLFLTGTVDAAITAKSAQLGAVGVVAKPFSAPALLECVNSHIRN